MKRPNGSGSVIKLGGKRRRPFAVRIFDGVKLNEKGIATPKYKYVGYYEKRADALKDLEKYNTSPVELYKEKESETKHKFSEIYDLWLEDLDRRPKKLSKNTFQSYQAAYKNLLPLHDKVFETLTIEDLESAAMANSFKSGSSITNIRIVIKGMYKAAMRRKYVSEDLSVLMIVGFKNENSRPHSSFTEQEISLLWKHKNDFYARLLLVLIYTGMRIRELLNLESENVFLEKRYLIGGSKTEAGKNRIIPISEKIVPLLDTSGQFVIMENNKPLKYGALNRNLTGYLDSLNMTHKFHDTRHTTATLMEQANIPELHRKLILGHKSTDITDHYTHVSKEQLIKDINLI